MRLLIGFGVAVLGLGTVGTMWLGSGSVDAAERTRAGQGSATPRGAADESRAARRSPVVDVFEASRDAVVNISSKEIITVRNPFGFESIFEDFFDMPFRGPGLDGPQRQLTRTSVGSGFVIHSDGYIVTNSHVVAQTAERKAIFADGREFDAQVIASDPSRDVAILKIDADQPLPTLKLGRSDDLMIGETVIAIGNPLGYQHTVTAGVVSAIDRDLQFARNRTLSGLIQTDASINPGNSGGPLLNVLGELIGVNTAIRGDAQNIGFAIPVDRLREVLPELLDVERLYRIVCGLSVDTLDSPNVTAVQPGSPAEKAGIKVGDVLCQIDGQPIHQGIDFSIALIGSQPNRVIDLELQRGGQPVAARVKLIGRPLPDGAALARAKLGLVLEELSNEVAGDWGLKPGSGLLITGVEPESPAEAARIQRRDVLLGVGRHAVSSLDDLGHLLEDARSGELITVSILRIDRRFKQMMTGELTVR